MPWLIKPFSFSPSLTAQEKKFNYVLSRARVVVEIAFGRLKARWRKLAKQIDMHIDNVPHILAACCVLHNVCEIHPDSFNEDWLEEVDLSSQPESVTLAGTSSLASQGDDVRAILMEHCNCN